LESEPSLVFDGQHLILFFSWVEERHSGVVNKEQQNVNNVCKTKIRIVLSQVHNSQVPKQGT